MDGFPLPPFVATAGEEGGDGMTERCHLLSLLYFHSINYPDSVFTYQLMLD
jgi:hypothetical protein